MESLELTWTPERLDQYNRILDTRGLSKGLGERKGEQPICIEAVICEVFGLPHGDDPGCIAKSVRQFKIKLNDKNWSSPAARANGLRKLGIAQIGSLGVINDALFTTKLSSKTIQILIVDLFRTYFPTIASELVDACELEPTEVNCRKLATYANDAAAAAAATNAATYAAATYAAATSAAATATNAANAATYAAAAADAAATATNAATYAAATTADKYLIMSANIVLDILIEMKSPGCAYL